MAEIIDLRAYLRTSGEGVFALVGNEVVEVMDISVAGIRLARPMTELTHRNVEFRIIPRSKAGLDIHRSVPVCGHIVGQGPDHIRIAFASVTMALANIVGCYHLDADVGTFPAAAMPTGNVGWCATPQA